MDNRVLTSADVSRIMYGTMQRDGFVMEDALPKIPIANRIPKNKQWSMLSEKAAAFAKERPGKWIIILRNVDSRSPVGIINYGRYKNLPSEEFEAKSRRTMYGQGYDILIRAKTDEEIGSEW